MSKQLSEYVGVDELLCSPGFLSLTSREKDIVARRWDFASGKERYSLASTAHFFGMEKSEVMKIEFGAFRKLKKAL